MTTIKIKTDLTNFKGCSTCPFLEYTDIIYCGEITGEYDANCGLLDGNMDETDCKQYDEKDGCILWRNCWVREDKRPDCPIIEFKIEEDP